MTLNLDQILADIEQLSASVDSTERRRWLQEARRLLRSHDRTRLSERLAKSREGQRPLLSPQPMGDLEERIAPPAAPPDYTVMAADGSGVPPDRTGPARYFVLNIGLVTLGYGAAPLAAIEARAELKHQASDLYWGTGRDRPVDERRLSLLMRICEIERLAEQVEQLGFPAIALVDGQLVMWGLQGEHPEDRAWLMGRLQRALARLHEYGIPLVGYISDTESFELVNALKIYLCPTTPEQCRQCHAYGPDEVQLCYHLNGFRDPALLFNFLEAGERSCLFASQATILKEYAPEQRIVYFYLSTGDEIARVEVPRWVADDPAAMSLVHALLHDQNRRSGQLPPYPPVLHEAHEAAVISSQERESIGLLIENNLQQGGRYAFRPAKSWHKRRRGV